MKRTPVEGRRNIVAELHRKVGYNGHYVLVVRDNAAGSSYPRYTVYRIPASPSRRTKVVGRELPIGLARKIAKRHAKMSPIYFL